MPTESALEFGAVLTQKSSLVGDFHTIVVWGSARNAILR